MKKFFHPQFSLFLLLLLLLNTGELLGQTTSWIRATPGGVWSDPANWSNGVPDATKDVTFTALTASTIDIPMVCRNITKTVGFPIIANASLTVHGNWNVNNFTAGTQRVIFTGNTNVTITGSASFNQLEVNKTSATNIVSIPNVDIANLILRQGVARYTVGNRTVDALEVNTGTSSLEFDAAIPTASRILTVNTLVEVLSGQMTIANTVILRIAGNYVQNGGTIIGAQATTADDCPVQFTGGTNTTLSGTAIDIRSAMNINKTAGAKVEIPGTSASNLLVGTAAANKSLFVQSGELDIANGSPLRVFGNFNIVANGIVRATNGSTIIQLTGDWNSNTAATPNPFIRGTSSVQFFGTAASVIRPSATTEFESLALIKTGSGLVTSLGAATNPLRIAGTLSINPGNVLRMSNVVDASTAVGLAVPFNHVAGAATTININVPNPDLIVRDVSIANGGGIDLFSNEPAGANTIAMHISGNLTDNNSAFSTATTGLHVGPNILSGGGSQGDNDALPTVVFVGGASQSIDGNTNGMRNYSNTTIAGLSGLYLPNVFVVKDANSNVVSASPAGEALRITGNLTVVRGKMRFSNNRLLFGNRDNDEILIYGVLEFIEGARLSMSTGGNGNGAFLRVMRGGLLRMIGSPSQRIEVDRDGNPGQYYRTEARPGGMLEVMFTNFNFQGVSNAGFFNNGGDRSDGGFKVHRGAIVNPVVTGDANYPDNSIGVFADLDDFDGDGDTAERGPRFVLITFATGTERVYPNFSYCSFAQGATGYTGLTINTGQTLTIVGARFTGSSDITNDNNIVASPVDTANFQSQCINAPNSSTQIAAFFTPGATVNAGEDQCGIIFMEFSDGQIGGRNGEGFDGGVNDTATPATDRIVWTNFNPIYWVGNYSGTGFTTRDPDGAGPQASQAYSGTTTEWNNWKNWSTRNDAYENVGQIFPGQTTAPFAGTYLRNWPGNPGNGTVPADTLKQFDVFLTRTAPTNPTLAQNLEIQGSIIVNGGVAFSGQSAASAGLIGQRLRRFDIIPQNCNAANKQLTLNGAISLTIGGSLILEQNTNNTCGNGNDNNAGLVALGAATIRVAQSIFINNNSRMSFGSDADPADTNVGDLATFVLNGIGEQELRFNNTRDYFETFIVDKPSGTVIVQGSGNTLRVNSFTMLQPSGSSQFRLSTNTRLFVNTNVALNGGTFIFDNSEVTVQGNWINNGGFVDGTQMFAPARMFFRPVDATATYYIRTRGQVFPQTEFQLSTGTNVRTYQIEDGVNTRQMIVGERFVIQTKVPPVDSTIAVQVTGLRVNNNSTFSLREGSELLVQTDPAFLSGGTGAIIVDGAAARFRAIGTQDRYVKISRQGTIGHYPFTFLNNARASFRFYNVQFTNENGVDLRNGRQDSPGITLFGVGCAVRAVGSFSDGTFTNGRDVADATYLYLPSNYVTQDIYNINFPLRFTAPGTSNVRRDNAIGTNAGPEEVLTGAFPRVDGGTTTFAIDDAPVGEVPGDTTDTRRQKTRFINATGVFAGENFDRETASGGWTGPADSVLVWSGRVVRWVNTSGGNWFVGANWDTGVVPTFGDAVIIDENGTYTIKIDGNFDTGTFDLSGIENPFAGRPAFGGGAATPSGKSEATCRDLIISPRGANTITLQLINGAELMIQRSSPCSGGVEFGGDYTGTTGAILTANIANGGGKILVGKGWSNTGTFNYGTTLPDAEKVSVTFNQPVGARVITTGPVHSPFWDLTILDGRSENNDSLVVDNRFYLHGQNIAPIRTPIFDASNVANISISVNGNWLNEYGLFVPRTGLVNLRGGNAQSITRVAATALASFERFYNLSIEKPANNVTLNNRVVVENTLSLGQGLFITELNRELIIGTNGTWTRNAGLPATTGFVSGPVGRIFNSANNLPTALNYPIGKVNVPYSGGNVATGSDGFAFQVKLTNPNPTAFTMEFFNNHPDDLNGDGSFPDYTPVRVFEPGSPLNMLLGRRYWKVRNIGFPSGLETDATGLVPDIDEARITLRFAGSQPPIDTLVNGVPYTDIFSNHLDLLNELSIVQDFHPNDNNAFARPVSTTSERIEVRRGFAPVGTIWKDLGGIPDVVSNTPSISSQENFRTLGNGQFTFGWNFTPLPVELLNFTAKVVEREVHLAWITVREFNSALFSVQRSSDGTNFTEIARLDAAGTSNSLKQYKYIDQSPARGLNYYRLVQEDFDSKRNTSKVVSVNVDWDALSNNPLVLYPNPGNGQRFHLSFEEAINSNTRIMIMDVSGKLVWAKNYERLERQTEITMEEPLKAGVYIVSIISDGKSQQKRMVVM